MSRFNKSLCWFAALLLVVSACKEPEQEIFSGLTPEEVSNSDNPALIDVLKASAYQRIIGNWGGHGSLWSMQEIASDEMIIAQKGGDWFDGGLWLRMHRHQYNAQDGAIESGWNYCYTAIGDINLLLQQYPDVDALNAELRVLRALVYLWLIDSYGNVPIILETDTDPTPDTNSRQEVYDFIESSVLDNIASLTTDDTKTTLNQWSARMILAKLYLNAEIYTGTAQWSAAKTQIDMIVNNGPFSLESNFFAPFATNNSGSSENILTLPYDQNNAGGFNLAQMTGHYLTQFTFDLQEQPWNGYASLEEFYNAYDDADTRKNGFLEGPQYSSSGERLMDSSSEPDDPDGPALTFTPEINELEPNSFRQAGVRVGKFEIQSGAGQSLSNDWPLFRYGDLLLMKAEVEWKLGNDAAALDAVNQVRTRAGVAALTTVDADILLAERGREMFAEGYRRSDLIRFGKYNEAWWEKEASDEFRNIFPIPQGQLDVNNGLTQNTGY
ncbi:RagB/SusD family nutrient uptake outer membrane protein [Roseivirga pacifica]|uniref:RagB/SusD family nutrient uptake outer membrane protein n=1 Tax=Roseivirga pacifica TaxID=1267423 RepID=UPI0020943E30|nr:RagB/SusD family nutrient uptake outer membrane protein [Roseivirga pacifica]MCO6359358.1 RagB/SusD family nutrient uptake outer membrane protein [Roseivirga pacifica]MCO6366728.1 RagB/SusD family nutrient uptake outer membrane protein [Roseivirga pacifica]MCO6370740.1 RagB/SusD family nutrient uptake outer membrane protein [Roseivirga pacifica]MCO6374384.1 RagB/SusD family nutrient uptake outer membrane protein [Roseivirga pacifica]MCO6379643.1 RagB/SusD family nutrient uptake outer membra